MYNPASRITFTGSQAFSCRSNIRAIKLRCNGTLVSQVTKALSPIAEKLRQIEGNYTRTMCESIYPLLLAYQVERRDGHNHDRWLAAGQRSGLFSFGRKAQRFLAPSFRRRRSGPRKPLGVVRRRRH